MKTFSHINFKKGTARRFREFSKKIAPTHTRAMEDILDFFELNKLSPNEVLGPNMLTLEKKLKNRIHALMAIIKDMEKHQTKPTVAMLQNLFEQADMIAGKSRSPNKKLWQERKTVSGQNRDASVPVTPELEDTREQLSFYKDKSARTTQELSDTKKEIATFLNKVKPIRSNFGKPYLRIDLPLETLEHLKRKLNLNE